MVFYWRGQEVGKEQIQTRTVAGKLFQVYKYYYAPSELEELIKTAFGKVEQILTTTYEQICVAH